MHQRTNEQGVSRSRMQYIAMKFYIFNDFLGFQQTYFFAELSCILYIRSGAIIPRFWVRNIPIPCSMDFLMKRCDTR